MEFRILGPLEVTKDGLALPLGPPKQRMLVAALLLRPNEIVSRDELIDALWGERPPERAAKSLQVYVWRLRKLLGRDVIETRPPGYGLVVSPDELDLHRFESLFEEARSSPPEKSAGLLRDALKLFRGRPLADFAYQRFAQAACARIDELRLQALEHRVEADLMLGRHAELVGELEALVAGEPLRERLRAQLMLALYRCGRQAEALGAFQDARRHLVEELGIEPGRSLKELQAAILRHDPSLELDPVPEAVDVALGKPDAPVEPGQTREERKVVTVLVAGIAPPVAEEERLDPEVARAASAPFHAAATSAVGSHGGTIERLAADGLTAVFGVPAAHEDDPERAVRAALEMRSWAAGRPDGPGVWIGLDTGVALVTLPATTSAAAVTSGAVVGSAQRLQIAAPVNGILVGADTHRATSDAFAYREAPPVEVRGSSRELPAWELLGERARTGGDVVLPPRAPLAGRRHELGLLVSTLARVLDERSPQLVSAVGVPGIGKSRLVLELRNAVSAQQEPLTWRQGRCLPYGDGISLWALGEMIKGQAAILESDGPADARAKLAAAVAGVVGEDREREWITSRLAPLVGAQLADASSPAERDESFAAWQRFLELLAGERPLVLVFEDLHWADDALLDFVDTLADRALAAPLLILCTARPELLDRRPGWGGGKPNSLTLTLQPLSDEETTSILGALLEEPLDAAVEQALVARAGGNPLYAEQFTRAQQEVGALDELPQTVQGIIAARLDGLSSDEKLLLQDAAVVGRVFWPGALESIGGVSPAPAEELLHLLERKQFVQRLGRTTIAGEAEYAFRHVLLRDVAYEQIPRAARAAKHRKAAVWIERISDERVTDHAEILAHHYGQALELLRALGTQEDRDALEEPYLRSLVLAGDRAAQLDVDRAEAFLARALELVPPGDRRDRAAVLTKAAEVAWLGGRYSTAEERYEEAIRALEAHGGKVELAEAIVSLSVVHAFRGETLRAGALLDEAVALLEREPRGPELARACAQMARRHTLTERWKEANRWSERALALAEQLDMKEVSALALQYRGQAKAGLGDLRGVDDLRRALQSSLGLGLGLDAVRAHLNLAILVWLSDGPAPGIEVQRAGIDLGERRGLTSAVMWGKAQMLWTLFDLGRWDAVVDHADEVIAWDRQLAGSYPGVMALNAKAHVLLLRGELDAAVSANEESLGRARSVEDPQVLAPALGVGAMVEHVRGDPDAAAALAEEFAGVVPRSTLEGGVLVHEVVRVCAAIGAIEVGERLIEARSEALTRHRLGLLTARAVLAETRGSLDDAARLYPDAGRRWSEYGFVLEHARALHGLGRCRAALRQADARRPLAEARALFGDLGARTLSTEVDALLAELESS